MSNTLALSVVLGSALGAGFKSTFDRAEGKIGELGRALGKTRAAAKKVDAYQRLKDQLGQTRNQFSDAQREVVRLKKAMQDKPASVRLAQRLSKARKASAKLGQALDKQGGRLLKAGVALQKAGVNTRDLAAESDRLKRSLKAQTTAWQKQSATLAKRSKLGEQFRGQMLKLGGTVLFGKQAIGSAVQFESAMADVRKVVDFKSPQGFAQMGNDITRLSLKLPMARDQIAAIVAAGAQASIPKKELLGFAMSATKMGVAFDLSADQAGQMMAQWRKAFSLNQKQVVALGDKINLLGNTAGASSQDIALLISKVGPLGKIGGLAGGEIAALGATMISMGINTDVAGTGVKNLMLAMTAGTSATTNQKKALTALGLDASAMAKRMQTDASGAIVNLLKHLKQLPKAQRAATLTNLLGRESVAAVAPLLANLDALKTNFQRVGDASKYSGSMQKEYLARASTTDMSLQLGKNAWEALTGAIGKVFLPTLKVVVGKFIDLTATVVTFSNKFPHLTAAVVAATTAFIGWKSAVIGGKWLSTFIPNVDKLGGSVRSLVPGLGMAEKGLSAFGKAWKAFNLSFMLSPAGLFITGIVAAIAVGALVVRKYWEPISAFMTGVWEGIKEAAGPVLDTLGKALAPLKPVWDGFINILSKVWNWFGNLLEPVHKSKDELAGITDTGRTVGHVLATAFKIVTFPLRMVFRLIGWLGKAIGVTIGWIVEHVKKGVQIQIDAWNKAIGFITNLWDGLKRAVTKVFDWIGKKVDWFVGKWKSLKNTVGGWFGMGDDDKPTLDKTRKAMAGAMVGVSFMTPAMAAQPQAQPSARFSQAVQRATANKVDRSTHTTHAPIYIQASPGMDAHAVAGEVRKQLDDRDRENAAKRRSALEDID